MFSDPVDGGSVLTGWSQQELLKNPNKEQERRNEKRKYGKKKRDKKKGESRILNLPSSFRTTSPSRRNYVRGIEEPPPAEAAPQQSRAAPPAISRNRVSRYAGGQGRMIPLAPAACDIRKRNWKIIQSLSRSSEDMESTQSSHGTSQEVPEVDNSVSYASIPITPSEEARTNEDIRAQAAEEWLKSNQSQEEEEEEEVAESTPLSNVADSSGEADKDDPSGLGEAKAAADDDFPILSRTITLSSSASEDGSEEGSEEERSFDEDGSFPTFGVRRRAVADPPFDEVMNQRTRRAPYGGVGDKHAGESSDKTSEESPVSVMSLNRWMYSAQGPAARQTSARLASNHPNSILRNHWQRRTSENDQDRVRSTNRVKFSDADVYWYHEDERSGPSIDQTGNLDFGYESTESQQSSEANDSRMSEPSRENKDVASLSPPRREEQFRSDGSFEPSVDRASTDSSSEKGFIPRYVDEDWNEVLSDVIHEKEVRIHQQAACVVQRKSSPLKNAILKMDGESMSIMSERSFIEAVAAVVVQTAIRRMLAIRAVKSIRAQHASQVNARRFNTKAVDMYELAAIDIQSAFRGWWVRDSLNVDHFCATRIQSQFRAYRCRMDFFYDIYRIIVVQSIWRRRQAAMAWPLKGTLPAYIAPRAILPGGRC